MWTEVWTWLSNTSAQLQQWFDSLSQGGQGIALVVGIALTALAIYFLYHAVQRVFGALRFLVFGEGKAKRKVAELEAKLTQLTEQVNTLSSQTELYREINQDAQKTLTAEASEEVATQIGRKRQALMSALVAREINEMVLGNSSLLPDEYRQSLLFPGIQQVLEQAQSDGQFQKICMDVLRARMKFLAQLANDDDWDDFSEEERDIIQGPLDLALVKSWARAAEGNIEEDPEIKAIVMEGVRARAAWQTGIAKGTASGSFNDVEKEELNVLDFKLIKMWTSTSEEAIKDDAALRGIVLDGIRSRARFQVGIVEGTVDGSLTDEEQEVIDELDLNLIKMWLETAKSEGASGGFSRDLLQGVRARMERLTQALGGEIDWNFTAAEQSVVDELDEAVLGNLANLARSATLAPAGMSSQNGSVSS